jgi:hypothetical protein
MTEEIHARHHEGWTFGAVGSLLERDRVLDFRIDWDDFTITY